MKYKFRNALTGLFEYADTEELTNARLAEIRTEYLKLEFNRFTVVKVVAVGDNTTWNNVDLDNDPEEGDYRMFIHQTGLYEPFFSLSALKARRQTLIDEFMVNIAKGTWTIVEKDGIQIQEFVEEDIQFTETRPIISVCCVANVYIRQMNFKNTGNTNNPHRHVHDHTTLLASGSVTCSVDGVATTFKAPLMIYIAKDKLHFFTALEDNTVAYCIHAIRHEGEDNDIISPESVPDGVDIRALGQPIQLAVS